MQLEVGELCVAAFGKELEVLHSLGQPWSAEQGAAVLARFGFTQTETNVRAMLAQTLDYLDEVLPPPLPPLAAAFEGELGLLGPLV